MENQDSVKVEVTKGLIEPIIKAKIEAEILRSMPSTEQMLQTYILGVLNEKVNHEGSVTQYSSDNKTPRIEFLVQTQLTEVIRESVKEHFQNPAVKAKLLKTIGKVIASKSNEVVGIFAETVSTVICNMRRQ